MEQKKDKGERLAKVIARYGVCSRREAEQLIIEGLVKVNGVVVTNVATNITDEAIKINNKLLNTKEPTRLWIFHKPSGFITTTKDPKDRKTIFSLLPPKMPRVITVGRLDMNTEGLLLLTNNGELARHLELPSTGWTRNYRARVFGRVKMQRLQRLERGITIEGIRYQAIKVELEKTTGANSWLKISLREGKNREIRKVLEYFGLKVNRLKRVSFGPFQLGELEQGRIKEVPQRVLRDMLGGQL